MRVILKIGFSVIIFFIGALITGLGKQLGLGWLLQVIVTVGIIAGISAVWKYNPNKDDDKLPKLDKKSHYSKGD